MPFALSPRLSIVRQLVGDEAEPVLVIDGLLTDPETLIAAAAESTFEPAWGPEGGYPGLRAGAPLDYVEAVARALLPAMIDGFGLPPAGLRRAECSLSLVTLPSDRLHTSQRAPHIDTTDGWQFALLHYLCGPEFGGTAFYRHRATGFAAVTPERWPAYEAARMTEPCAGGYVTDSDPWFERIGGVKATFNRLVIYRSRLLHSGVIAAPERLSSDPRRGRLTANIFLTLGEKRVASAG